MANKTEKGLKRPLIGLGAARTPLPASSAPEIHIGETALGRATLADVKDDLRRAPGPRAPMMTVSYNDLPLDAKRIAAEGPAIEVAESSASALWRAVDAGPAIELGEASLGRETLALIELDEEPVVPLEKPRAPRTPVPRAQASLPRPPTPIAPKPAPNAATCEALELKSFIVPSSALSPKASEEARRAFVRDRLAGHLPCPFERIKRIDARLFEPGAVLIRVFCPLD